MLIEVRIGTYEKVKYPKPFIVWNKMQAAYTELSQIFFYFSCLQVYALFCMVEIHIFSY